ncbi:MAG: putative Ig domain-containing protein, partial [Bdellovibrionales bacterium]|nr:putative Ig domain-containing protein [Bdellovibrionales bacterium]
TVTNSEFVLNKVDVNGSAITNSGHLTLTNTLFWQNRAIGNGTINYITDTMSNPITNMTGVTFYDNVADQGAILKVTSATNLTVNINYSTIVENYNLSSTAGVIAAAANSTINFSNTILSGSAKLGGASSKLHCSAGAGTIASLGYNLTDQASTDCNTNQGTDINSTGAQMDRNLYGNFPRSLLPAPNSPAIDNGYDTNCPATDASGRTRLVNIPALGSYTCDIGAAEVQATSLPPRISYQRSWRSYLKNHTQSSLTPVVKGTVTSFSITPSLPAGMSFSTSTGVISGTPTETSTQITYTITASNSVGSYSEDLILEVLDGYLVNTTNDENVSGSSSDNVCNSSGGNCSLRAAIAEANGVAGKQIIFIPNGNYVISNALGQMLASETVVMVGESMTGTSINGSSVTNDRFLDTSTGINLWVSDFEIKNFTITNTGAGIYFRGLYSYVSHMRFANNSTDSASAGGAYRMLAFNIFTLIEYSQFEGNTALGKGGGISSVGKDINIKYTHFKNNTASGSGNDGAGMQINSNQQTYNLLIESCTFEGGTASSGAHGGGAFFSFGGTGAFLRLKNNTFYNNSATRGGALYLNSGTQWLLINNTFVGNNAGTNTTNGGAIWDVGNSANVTMSNNIFYDNRSNGTLDDCNSNDFVSLGGNISGMNDGHCNWGGSDQTSTDPKLADASPTLANGGYVPTMSLQGTSPAIDAGIGGYCSANDARFEWRPVKYGGSANKCDAGAVESQ